MARILPCPADGAKGNSNEEPDHGGRAGGFAVDQFYLNERPKGLWWWWWWLLLLPPVAGVLALIAAIRHITMPGVEFDRRHNGSSVQ